MCKQATNNCLIISIKSNFASSSIKTSWTEKFVFTPKNRSNNKAAIITSPTDAQERKKNDVVMYIYYSVACVCNM